MAWDDSRPPVAVVPLSAATGGGAWAEGAHEAPDGKLWLFYWAGGTGAPDDLVFQRLVAGVWSAFTTIETEPRVNFTQTARNNHICVNEDGKALFVYWGSPGDYLYAKLVQADGTTISATTISGA